MVVHDIILFLHFFGLMLGAAGGMSSGIIMRKALTMPADDAKTIRSLGPLLARVAHFGVALLWITGLILVFSYWEIASLPTMFWVKMVFVLALTIVSILVEMTYHQIKAGNLAVAARLPRLGPFGGISALLSVFFAVLAFH